MCTCVRGGGGGISGKQKKIQSAVVQITILDSFLSEVFWSDSISITISDVSLIPIWFEFYFTPNDNQQPFIDCAAVKHANV